MRPLSKDDKNRQKIAKDNYSIVKSHKYYIDRSNVETIFDEKHNFIFSNLGPPKFQGTYVSVNEFSSIKNAIYCKKHYCNNNNCQICVLNFANSTKPGGGYLNGRSSQEESLCRQTLLYPTIDKNPMYEYNKQNNLKVEGSDVMIYSPNVYVIRDDNYNLISDPFTINIITSPAVDNRSNIENYCQLMEIRIRKIINLAAFKGNQILILGAFGCGVFKNNPAKIANIFYKVLIHENMKDYFQYVFFPVYKNNQNYLIFKSVIERKNNLFIY